MNPWLAISVVGLSAQTLVRQLFRPLVSSENELLYQAFASLPNFLCAGVIVPFLFLICREILHSYSAGSKRNNLHLWFFLGLPISTATIIIYENAAISAIFFNTSDVNDVIATYLGSIFAIAVYYFTLRFHPHYAPKFKLTN